ncbi:hypothetical protein MMC28_002674 [Mycoblastus sanguinarius]|nr:hypothetical protein [Mycoblastus sanguinarius]
MVLVALGVLLVSLSLFVYKYKPPRRAQTSRVWKGKEALESAGAGEDQDDEKGKSPDPSLPIVTLNRGNNGKRDMLAKTREKHQDDPPDFASGIKPATRSEPRSQSENQSMPPPARPSPNVKRKAAPAPSSLMPPPSKPLPSNPTARAPPKPSTALRPPPSAASTLRGPPSRSLAPPTSSLAPSTSTLSPPSRPSKKVLLDPGHSPLDWAHLIAHPPNPTFLRGADVPPSLIRVPPSLLRYHSGRKGKDAWGVYQGKVYNLSPYMKFHPGGVDQLMRAAGMEKDGEKLFNEVHPWVSWENMLGECLVGILVSESEVQPDGVNGGNSLEEMD